MFGLSKALTRKKQVVPQKFIYQTERNGERFDFISDEELSESQYSTAMDIIQKNWPGGISGMVTAREIFEQCFEQSEYNSISIQSDDEGKSWTIKISKNSLEFQ